MEKGKNVVISIDQFAVYTQAKVIFALFLAHERQTRCVCVFATQPSNHAVTMCCITINSSKGNDTCIYMCITSSPFYTHSCA